MSTQKSKGQQFRLTPAGYLAVIVLAAFVVLAAVSACRGIDQQFIHPFGQNVPVGLVADPTQTPQPKTATAQPAQKSTATATSSSDASSDLGLTPLATDAASPTVTATATRTATATPGLPWAGQLGPGKPVPGEVTRAIKADWEEIYHTINDYSIAKSNSKLNDKTWWIEQGKRSFLGADLQDWFQQIDGWFKKNSDSSPGFLENGRYTLQVERCDSDTKCYLQVHIESGQFWTYDITAQKWIKANLIKPTDAWSGWMQYDLSDSRWKIGGNK